jgi:hypothetical protein
LSLLNTNLDINSINEIALKIEQMIASMPPLPSAMPKYPSIRPPIASNLIPVSIIPSLPLGTTPNVLPYPDMMKSNISKAPLKPKIQLIQSEIQKTYPLIFYFLYDAINLQCKQCAIRFHDKGNGKEVLDAHLDWHYRQNKKQRDKVKKTVSREWYLDIQEWLSEQPTEPLDNQGNGKVTSRASIF